MPTFADSPKTLTPRQQRFVAAYVVWGNASKAAHEAGYSDAKNEGHRLIHRPPIQAAIQKRMDEVLLTYGSGVTPDEPLIRSTPRARAPLAAICQQDQQGRGQLTLNPRSAQEATSTERPFKGCIIAPDENTETVEEQEVHDVSPALYPLVEPRSTIDRSLNEEKAKPVTLSNTPEPMPEGQAVIRHAEPLLSMPAAVVQRVSRVEQGSVPSAPAKPDLATRRLEAARRLLELGQTVLDRQSFAFLQARYELSDVIPYSASGAEIVEWARREVERA